MTDPAGLYEEIAAEVGTVLIGKEEIVERLTIALLTRGHVLLEGVPGVAKTTGANLFARATGLRYNRIQMTPDTLPADITGTHVYREATGEFVLQRGPVFANLVVADEINRATPKTQSALLEAMQERTVTIEGESLDLPTPFMVIATQNPIEYEGTFALPEAQRDRFQFKLTAGLPTRDEERELLDRFDANPELGTDDVEQVVDPDDLLAAREVVSGVHVDPTVKEYVLNLVAATRDHPDIEHGGSPRASLAFLNAGKARAVIRGREYVIPDDVKALAAPILVHRLVLSTDAELSDVSAETVVAGIVDSVEPPAGFEADTAPEIEAVSDGGDPGREGPGS
jgi:MoxR-like ATPase